MGAWTWGVLAWVASAGTLSDRVKDIRPAWAAPPDAPGVAAGMPVVTVEATRVGVAPGQKGTLPLDDELFPPQARADADTARRVSQSALVPRLKALAQGGATDVALVVDARASLQLLAAVVQAVEDAGLRVHVVDPSSTPWKTVVDTRLHACGDLDFSACAQPSEGCDVPRCAELHFAAHPGGGQQVWARRRVVDVQGACLDDAAAAGEQAAPWDGLVLSAGERVCPALPSVSAAAVEKLHAEVSRRLPVCGSAGVHAPPGTVLSDVAPLLQVLRAKGARTVRFQVEPTPTCDGSVPMAALSAQPPAVNAEVQRVTGGHKAPAVVSALRGRRHALALCAVRSDLSGEAAPPSVGVVLRLAEAGRVASVKWEGEGVGAASAAFRACVEGALKDADAGRAPRGSEARVLMRFTPAEQPVAPAGTTE